MVAALDFVPGIAARGVIAVVDRAADGQALVHHPFPDHVPGRLVLEAVHALVEVDSRSLRATRAASPWGQVHMMSPASPAMAIPAARLVGLARNGPTSGAKLYFQSDCKACSHVRPPRECGPGRPARPSFARTPGRSRSRRTSRRCLACLWVGSLDVILAVEKLVVEAAAAALDDAAAFRWRKASSPISRGHFLARPQRGQVERTEPGDLAEPGLIERVVLRALQKAVSLVRAGSDTRIAILIRGQRVP